MDKFPIKEDWQTRARYNYLPESIPLSVMEHFRENIEQHHGRTLENIVKNGGLSCIEVFALINDMSVEEARKRVTISEAGKFLNKL